ncbi:hypothetical protein [Conexibacter sp. SYSU D00693]|uniref:hypothetical protein n=1 Tax=Conexibacter sp. SYSU D00693 TaxID=2812560 RepID=UPI00196B977B|nr:hypothetical protein [Conexibacter sp. SYSU D00693]
MAGERLAAYGLRVAVDGLGLPGAVAAPAGAPADVAVRRAGRAEVLAAFSGPADPPRRATRRVDGAAVHVERGAAGDLLLDWERGGVFRADAHGATVLAHGEPDARWRRFLLDSVLVPVALLHGAEALHAGTVEVGGAGIAVAAGQGGGKTTLLGALLARGARLVADDVSVLRRDGGAFAVAPAPPVLNVARERPAGAAGPPELGEVLAELDGELWVHARAVAPAPVALGLLVRLERGPDRTLRAARQPPSARTALSHFLPSGPEPERRRAQFELAADLAAQVPLVVLEAPPDAPPGTLAERVLAAARTGRP